jgi:hypothetical protein
VFFGFLVLGSAEGRIRPKPCGGFGFQSLRGLSPLKPYTFTRIKRLNINSQLPSFIGARCTNFQIYHLSEDPVYRLGFISQASLAFHFRFPFQEPDRFFPQSRI